MADNTDSTSQPVPVVFKPTGGRLLPRDVPYYAEASTPAGIDMYLGVSGPPPRPRWLDAVVEEFRTLPVNWRWDAGPTTIPGMARTFTLDHGPITVEPGGEGGS